MVTRDNFEKIAWIVTAVMVAVTILFMSGKSLGLESVAPAKGYEARLFDNSRVHTIDIVMDDWDSFIENAAKEEYALANVVIDGELIKNVGIRGKGNTSLSSVASMNSSRYSLKIEFDQYDNSKTYYGLDKLALNNMIQDTTMMKDYLAYTLMNEFGVDSPLCSYVYVTVNGEDWGLYLAVEGVEDAFLERNYGAEKGNLYKPDSMSFGGGRGNGKSFNMTDFWNENFKSSDDETQEESENNQPATETAMPDFSGNGFPQMETFGGDFGSGEGFGGSFPPAGDFEGTPGFGEGFNGNGFPQMGNFPGSTEGMPSFPDGEVPASSEMSGNQGQNRSRRPSGFGPGGGMGMGSSDVKLQYIDDDPDSYSNIWENTKTDIAASDKRRLINSLKTLSSYEDIESVVDIDEVLRYFVVHNFVCNGDSYTGNMIHNYYLHEKDGKLSMIPWDYNLAFGTFQGSNAQSTVNTPIDTAYTDRPMVNWIFEDENYTELYHQLFAEFLDTVDISAIIDEAYALIAPYVEKDPTKFYTVENFEKGVETLRKFCELRSESVTAQLENGDTVNTQDWVDASDLNLSEMGSMGGGGNKGGMGFGGERPGRHSSGGQKDDSPITAFSQEFQDENESGSTNNDDPQVTWNETYACETPECKPEAAETKSADSEGENNNQQMPFGGSGMMPPDMPFGNGGMTPPDMSFGPGQFTQQSYMKQVWIYFGVSMLAAAIGLIIAKKYRL